MSFTNYRIVLSSCVAIEANREGNDTYSDGRVGFRAGDWRRTRLWARVDVNAVFVVARSDEKWSMECRDCDRSEMGGRRDLQWSHGDSKVPRL